MKWLFQAFKCMLKRFKLLPWVDRSCLNHMHWGLRRRGMERWPGWGLQDYWNLHLKGTKKHKLKKEQDQPNSQIVQQYTHIYSFCVLSFMSIIEFLTTPGFWICLKMYFIDFRLVWGGTCYHSDDLGVGSTCLVCSPLVASIADIPQMPLKAKGATWINIVITDALLNC